jgi:hypothetical protein
VADWQDQGLLAVTHIPSSSPFQVFLRHGVYDPLEVKVREVLRRYAIVIQKIYRGFIAKKSLALT